MSVVITQRLKDQARSLGFAEVGICPAGPTPGWDAFSEWLDRGYAGEMRYLPERRGAYAHPRSVLDGVRSLALFTVPYVTVPPKDAAPGQGKIARYAWGDVDYHDWVHARLKKLICWLQHENPDGTYRGVVDTAPLLERQFAQLAGLGWQGKNTLLLNRQCGSLFFLAALLTDQVLAHDAPFETDHCGSCTACLDACPTDAFPEPYVLDATRCISYFTIEKRTPVDAWARPKLADWLFGCDVCQDVCPWNRRLPAHGPEAFAPRPDQNPIDLVDLFALSDKAFRERFRGTPLFRAKRTGILRNAAYLLGQQRFQPAVPSLIVALDDPDPIVRGAVVWALQQWSDDAEIQTALDRRAAVETDANVMAEFSQPPPAAPGLP